MQSIFAFPDTPKMVNFRWKNADGRCHGLCHVIHIFFGSSLEKIIVQICAKILCQDTSFWPLVWWDILVWQVQKDLNMVKVFYYICLRNSIFNFCNHKSFFRPIWNIALCKNVSIFWYSYMVTKFKFRIFITIFYIKINVCA